MNILALDPGTKTGWANWSYYLRDSGVQDFSLKRGESRGMRFVRFTAWLKEFIEITKPHIVVYESPHFRGGYATEVLIGMITRVQEICELAEIQYTSIHSATLKKSAVGKGNAKKEVILKAAREKFGYVEDDNEADALFMLEWARKEFNGNSMKGG